MWWTATIIREAVFLWAEDISEKKYSEEESMAHCLLSLGLSLRICIMLSIYSKLKAQKSLFLWDGEMILTDPFGFSYSGTVGSNMFTTFQSRLPKIHHLLLEMGERLVYTTASPNNNTVLGFSAEEKRSQQAAPCLPAFCILHIWLLCLLHSSFSKKNKLILRFDCLILG